MTTMVAKNEQKTDVLHIMFRPQRQNPPRTGIQYISAQRVPWKPGIPAFENHMDVMFRPGRNKVSKSDWEVLLTEDFTHQQLRLGALEIVEPNAKPPGERPEDLRDVSLDDALAWIECEMTPHVLKSWKLEDYRSEIQAAINLRLAEIKENRA